MCVRYKEILQGILQCLSVAHGACDLRLCSCQSPWTGVLCSCHSSCCCSVSCVGSTSLSLSSIAGLVNTKQVLCADLIADGWQSECTSKYQSVNCWEECLHVKSLYDSLPYLCTCPSPPPHILPSPCPSPTSTPPSAPPSAPPPARVQGEQHEGAQTDTVTLLSWTM